MRNTSSFEWELEIVVKHLLWEIKADNYKAFPMELSSGNEDFHIFCCCIDNFVEMGRHNEIYAKSQGTDGNPVTSFKIKTRDGAYYYAIGKLNAQTGNEEIHIFYCRTPMFDIMQCSYVGGGTCEEGSTLGMLWRTCV